MNLKKCLDVYFNNLEEVIDKYKKIVGYKYSESKCYKDGFYPFYVVIKELYCKEFKISYRSLFESREGKKKKLNPHFGIKKYDDKLNDGIYIYLNPSIDVNDRYVKISLELGYHKEYSHSDEIYNQNVKKIKNKYQKELSKLEKIVKNIGLSSSGVGEIFETKVYDFEKIKLVIKEYVQAYRQIISQITDWNDSWKNFQNKVFYGRECEKMECKHWIIPSNENYDLESNLKDYKIVEWKQVEKANVNDIFYIYQSGSVQKIKYKMIAKKINLSENELEITKDYWIDKTKKVFSSSYMQLELIAEINNDKLNYQELKKYGLKSKLQSFESLDKKPKLLAFIEAVFNNDYDYSWNKMKKHVYIDDKEYNDICRLLEKNKNLILEGPPGVGKTHIAKLLVYSLLKERDDNRLLYIQFHQSYSYEDFVNGYRPTKEGGFELKSGAFKDFCERARGKKNNYYVIIDEMNRGNLSKIFGELLTLVESDKRDKYYIRLANQKKNEIDFTIPTNVYLIGLMNTADRSLANMDYALRRRFAFFPIEPMFARAKFKEYQDKIENTHFKELIKGIIELNNVIAKDDSLGEEFMIGHSYFSNLDSKVTDEELEDILKYEIKPLLKEYWYDNKERANKEINKLLGIIGKLDDKSK